MLPYGKSACRVRRTGMGNGVFANRLQATAAILDSTIHLESRRIDFALLPSRGSVNPHAISAERERWGWPQTLGYLLFYDDHRRQTHVRDCCRKPALPRSPPRGSVIVSIFWPNGIADPKPTPTKLASSRRSVLVPKSRTVTAAPWPPCWVVNDPGKGGAHGGQADAVQERQKGTGRNEVSYKTATWCCVRR
jgi:hypothetical protein